MRLGSHGKTTPPPSRVHCAQVQMCSPRAKSFVPQSLTRRATMHLWMPSFNGFLRCLFINESAKHRSSRNGTVRHQTDSTKELCSFSGVMTGTSAVHEGSFSQRKNRVQAQRIHKLCVGRVSLHQQGKESGVKQKKPCRDQERLAAVDEARAAGGGDIDPEAPRCVTGIRSRSLPLHCFRQHKFHFCCSLKSR